MSKAQYKCLACQLPFMARTADRKRGWARFCSKSCKAKRQEARTGQYARLLAGGETENDQAHLEPWDDHKF